MDTDTYASSVLDFISTNIDSVTTLKQITTFPNQKPWMNREVRLLLNTRNIAFRSGDAQAYSASRANLKRGIREAKHSHKLRIEEHFWNSDPQCMWQGIQDISDYKPTITTPQTDDISLLDELNNFYARFDRETQEAATKVVLPADHQPITLSPTDVCAALSRTNARTAAGPDGISEHVLRVCAGQLAGVLTDIFSVSLAQAVIPTCFKTTCQCSNIQLPHVTTTQALLHSPPPS